MKYEDCDCPVRELVYELEMKLKTREEHDLQFINGLINLGKAKGIPIEAMIDKVLMRMIRANGDQ